MQMFTVVLTLLPLFSLPVPIFFCSRALDLLSLVSTLKRLLNCSRSVAPANEPFRLGDLGPVTSPEPSWL